MNVCLLNKAIHNVHKKWVDFGMLTNYNNTIRNVHRKWTIHPPNGDIEQLLDIERTLTETRGLLILCTLQLPPSYHYLFTHAE